MSKKFTVIAIAVAVILGVVILIDPDNKNNPQIPESSPVDASTEANREGYFASHGWEVEEIGAKDITIPSDFSDGYERYAALQDKQGMPLREYAGRAGKLYVYEVKNYSPNKKMLAELIVCDDTAVASLVYSDSNDLQMSVS